MIILPLGKMSKEAQGIDSPLLQDPTISGEVSQESLQEETPQIEQHESNTLTDYIFKKLQEFGYPGRRLEEFKKNFVSEDISPDGTKNKVVEIPDKRYPDQATGTTKTIEDKELSSMIREIQEKFGIHFNGAKRSDGKWIINFTSANVENKEEAPITDNLDDVYGTPNKGKKRKTTVRASTFKELIQEGKDNIIEKLGKIIGDQNGS